MKNNSPIGIVVRENLKVALESAFKVVTWAIENNKNVVVEDLFKKHFDKKGITNDLISFSDLKTISLSCSPIVTLGGDGTLIGVARYVDESFNSPTFIGVNFGQLGFLTEIQPSEILETLNSFYKGETETVSRRMLKATINSGESNSQNFVDSKEVQSVNDLVIQRGAKDPLLNLGVTINNEFLMDLRADGLILSTPTGSTAYSLAAGGSIVLPQLPVTLLTPLCPHSLTIRPLILPSDLKIEVRVPKHKGNVYAIFDGQESYELNENDSIVVTQSKNTVHFVKSSNYSYFEILQKKLNWGKGNLGKM